MKEFDWAEQNELLPKTWQSYKTAILFEDWRYFL